MLSTSSNCNCCGQSRTAPRARWERCLNFRKPSCPVISMNANNVLSPNPAHHSRNIVRSKIIKHGTNNATGRWRTVNWKRMRLQQETAQFQSKVVAHSTNNKSGRVYRNAKVINIPPSNKYPCGTFTNDPTANKIPEQVISCCPKTPASNLTWEQIASMPIRGLTGPTINKYLGIAQPPFGGPVPNCKYYKQEGLTGPGGFPSQTISLLQENAELGNYLSEYL